MNFRKKDQRPPPHNPPEWTEVQRWVIETLMDHTRSLGVIEGILKVAIPIGVTVVGGLLSALLVLQLT